MPICQCRASGLVWRGRPDHKNDRNRSMPAAALAPLTRLPYGWVSLQQGVTAEELAALGGPLQLGDSFGDLQDAAEAIAALDSSSRSTLPWPI
ncbi:MAG: hypothetical protein WDN69_10530 [Aliidongia sp.]